MKKFLVKNWHLLLAGIALTAFALPHTYSIRGYFAIGGEWLILPVILLIDYMVREVVQDVFGIIIFKGGDEE